MTKIAPATFIDQSLRADPDFGPGCLIKEQGMAVKRVVVYPYPKDIDAFESVYNNEHVSDGNRKPERKDKDCRDKGIQVTPAFPNWSSSLPPQPSPSRTGLVARSRRQE